MAFSKPIRPLHIPGITPEQRERRRRAMERLGQLVWVHTAPIARSKAEAIEGAGEQAFREHTAALPFYKRWSLRLVALLAWRSQYRKRAMQDAFVADEVRHAARALAYGWAGVCAGAAEGDSGDLTLSAARLDEAMLPLSGTEGPSLAEFLDGTVITTEDARTILTQLRATLPADKKLPDELIELLATHGVAYAP
jgi:hypothetical protein